MKSNIKIQLILLAISVLCACGVKDMVVTDKIIHCDIIKVTDFGIKNNGLEVIDSKIQSIIDTENANDGAVLFFPKGEYLVGQLDVPAGFTIRGEDGTVFKKQPNSGKFSRMITSVKHKYSGNRDSEPLVVENIEFDGQYKLQGPYLKYQLEHQAMIFLHASNDKEGRLKAIVRNCTFKNGVGDAVHIHTNTDAKVENIYAENVFRGALTITGGHSVINAKNIIAKGDVHKTGIDVEIDGTGYNGSHFIDFYGENFDLAGDFDLGLKDGGKVHLKNVTSHDVPFNVHTPNGTVLIESSDFTWKGAYKGKIYFPTNTEFRNTTFTFDFKGENTIKTPIGILWNTSYRESKDLNLRFIGCTFRSIGNPVIGIYNYPDFANNKNRLHIEDCRFEGNFSVNVDYKFGGSLTMKNTHLDGESGVVLRSLVNARRYTYDATFENITSSSRLESPVEYQEDSENIIKVRGRSDIIKPILTRNALRGTTLIKINN